MENEKKNGNLKIANKLIFKLSSQGKPTTSMTRFPEVTRKNLVQLHDSVDRISDSLLNTAVGQT